MRKEQIVEMKQQKNILNEKKILDMMDHPFILKLAGHYHDNAEVYGGDIGEIQGRYRRDIGPATTTTTPR